MPSSLRLSSSSHLVFREGFQRVCVCATGYARYDAQVQARGGEGGQVALHLQGGQPLCKLGLAVGRLVFVIAGWLGSRSRDGIEGV